MFKKLRLSNPLIVNPESLEHWQHIAIYKTPDGEYRKQVPVRQAKIIARNVLAGKSYHIASPMYSLTREEIALIHVNAREILKLHETKTRSNSNRSSKT